jgi:hypothetical protein
MVVSLISIYKQEPKSNGNQVSAKAPATPPTSPTPEWWETRPPELLRSDIASDYVQMIDTSRRGFYNHVTAKTSKTKGGYTLYAYHEFFNEYEFSAGDFAHDVQKWIRENGAKLRKAGIVKVGVHGTGPYSSGVWYSTK